MKEISLKTWLKNYRAGVYNKRNVDTMIKAGWHDWFCSNRALFNRLKRLAPKVEKLSKTKKIRRLGLDKVYVWFKNNAPFYGPLYDDFRISRLSNHEVLYTVVPSCPYNNNKPVVYSSKHNGEFIFKNWYDVVRWFNEEPTRYSVKFRKYSR